MPLIFLPSSPFALASPHAAEALSLPACPAVLAAPLQEEAAKRVSALDMGAPGRRCSQGPDLEQAALVGLVGAPRPAAADALAAADDPGDQRSVATSSERPEAALELLTHRANLRHLLASQKRAVSAPDGRLGRHTPQESPSS